MSNVPVLQSVRGAIEFRRLHWREVAGVLAVVSLGATVNAAGEMSGQLGVAYLGQLVYIVSAIMGFAALMRLAFADEHPGDPEFRPGAQGFQFGKPELRLVGVGLLLAFVALLGFLFFIFVGVLIAVTSGIRGALKPGSTPEDMMAAMGPGGSMMISLLALAFLVVGTVVWVRTSLAPAATISRRRISLFDTWGLTKGQFWRIFAANFLVSLPSVAAAVLLGLVLSAFGHPTGPNGSSQLPMPGALLAGAISGLVVGFIQLPLSVGLVAYLFRGLRPAAEAQVLDTRSDALIGGP